MKKLFALMLLCTTVAFAGCSKDDNNNEQPEPEPKITDRFQNEDQVDGSTSEKAYIIKNAEQLTLLAERMNGEDGAKWRDKCYKMVNDIDFGTEEVEWEPIAPSGMKIDGMRPMATFCGEFDGGNYTIKGKLLFSGNGNNGIFASLNYGGKVKNLRIEGQMRGSASGRSLGVIVGSMSGGSVIHCHNAAEFIAEGTYIGGIVGICSTIEGNYKNEVIACTNTGTISSKSFQGSEGAIVGSILYGTVIGCINKGEVVNACSIVGYGNGNQIPSCCWSSASTLRNGFVSFKHSYFKKIEGSTGQDEETVFSGSHPTAEQITDMNTAWQKADAACEYQFNAITGEIEKKP